MAAAVARVWRSPWCAMHPITADAAHLRCRGYTAGLTRLSCSCVCHLYRSTP